MVKPLSTKQRMLAELMVANPSMTNLEFAAEVDIDPKTLYKWKKEAVFQEYYTQLCREKFKDLQGLAVTMLKENIRDKNQKAIEYALNGAGYKPVEKLEASIDSEINIIIK